MRWRQLSPGNGFFEPVKSGPTCVRDATHWMPLPPHPYGAEEHAAALAANEPETLSSNALGIPDAAVAALNSAAQDQ